MSNQQTLPPEPDQNREDKPPTEVKDNKGPPTSDKKDSNNGSGDLSISQPDKHSGYSVVALTRIYSGIIEKGTTLHFLKDDNDPNSLFGNSEDKPTTELQVETIYTIKGSDMVVKETAEAGEVVGLTFASNDIVCSGTITNDLQFLPFIQKYTAEPIMQFIIEPVDPNELPGLESGLKLLRQSDPGVEVSKVLFGIIN